jgi:hypothetical protein
VTTDPVTPLRVARLAGEVCVRALPTWEQRLRYRAEFLADLQTLPPSDQLRYAAGVLSQTLALRPRRAPPLRASRRPRWSPTSRVAGDFSAVSCGGTTGEA